jgi:hypothetical protein
MAAIRQAKSYRRIADAVDSFIRLPRAVDKPF